MGILLGLLTALSWGSSDFLARFASRRIGSLRTTFYMQLTGLVLLTICIRWIGGWGHLFDGSGWQPWAWGASAGLLNSVSTLCLYRSFEVGKMAVVAPVSASYPALTVAISFLTGEHLTALRVGGIVMILVGVVIVVRGEAVASSEVAAAPGGSAPADGVPVTLGSSATTPDGVTARAVAPSGIGMALISALGFGVLFWLLGNHVVPHVGFASAVWMIRLISSVVSAIVILAMGRTIALPRKSGVSMWLLGMGVLDTGAFVLNNLGMQMEQVSVVSVLASLYGAVTVLLASVVLHEHLSKMQWFGIVAIFAGITAISL
jgi:drug/metabolite transporter (DMT)-like permease